MTIPIRLRTTCTASDARHELRRGEHPTHSSQSPTPVRPRISSACCKKPTSKSTQNCCSFETCLPLSDDVSSTEFCCCSFNLLYDEKLMRDEGKEGDWISVRSTPGGCLYVLLKLCLLGASVYFSVRLCSWWACSFWKFSIENAGSVKKKKKNKILVSKRLDHSLYIRIVWTLCTDDSYTKMNGHLWQQATTTKGCFERMSVFPILHLPILFSSFP